MIALNMPLFLSLSNDWLHNTSGVGMGSSNVCLVLVLSVIKDVSAVNFRSPGSYVVRVFLKAFETATMWENTIHCDIGAIYLK